MNYVFGEFILDMERGELRGRAGPVAIEPKAISLLAFMLEHTGRLIDKEELVETVWGGRIVSDSAISTAVKAVRRAIGDDGTEQTWLKTIRGRGFRFDGPVEKTGDKIDHPGLDKVDLGDEATHCGDHSFASNRSVLAVLPFEELSASADTVFADGVVEEITGALSRARDFDVIARQSAFALRNMGLSAPEAAKLPLADYLLEGTVRRAGDRVRIAVKLVNGADGRLLWSEQFDDFFDDLFEMQERIAAQVAGRVFPSLRSAEITRAGRRAPKDRTAYETLLTAYPHFWSLKQDDNQQAGTLLDQALKIDGDYVPALALRAWVHAQQNTYMWSKDPIWERERSLALANKAAEKVTDHSPSLVAIAGAYAQTSPDRALAETWLARVFEVDPNNAWAWIRLGWLRQYVGEVDAALQAFDQAERLSPLDPFSHQITFGRAATHYRWSDDPTVGLAMIEEGLRRHPGVLWPWRMVAVANVRLGRLSRAHDAAMRLLEGLPHLTIRYLSDCLPPGAKYDDGYLKQLSIAGIPD